MEIAPRRSPESICQARRAVNSAARGARRPDKYSHGEKENKGKAEETNGRKGKRFGVEV